MKLNDILVILQNIENVTSKQIDLLAQTVSEDIESNLEGTIFVDGRYCYKDSYDKLRETYPKLYINGIDDYYIRFEDPEMLKHLLEVWGYGNNHGMILAEAANAVSVGSKTNNSPNLKIEKFNELKYFTNITSSKNGWNSGSYGNIVFKGWVRLKEVDISNFTSIGHCTSTGYEDTFYGCSSLKTVTASNRLKLIGHNAFATCYSLENIANLEGDIELYGSSFYNCRNLLNSTFENCSIYFTNVTSDKNGTFENCEKITSINISDKSTAISRNCFKNSGLNRLTGDLSNVTEIGLDAFYLSLIKDPVLGEDFPLFENAEKIYGGAFHNTGLSGELNLPNLILLGSSAFSNCNITSVDLSNLTRIEGYIFENNTNLKSIGDISLVTFIGSGAFFNCDLDGFVVNLPNLEAGLAPFDLATNAVGVFYNTNIKGIESLGNVTKLRAGAYELSDRGLFCNCKKLEYVKLGNITEVYGYTFSNCMSLTEVYGIENLTYIGSYAFNNCPLTKTELVSDKNIIIGQNAFNDSNIKKVSLKNTTMFPNNAFQNCSNAVFELPEKIRCGDNAFYYCKHLPEAMDCEVGNFEFNGGTARFNVYNTFKGTNVKYLRVAGVNVYPLAVLGMEELLEYTAIETDNTSTSVNFLITLAPKLKYISFTHIGILSNERQRLRFDVIGNIPEIEYIYFKWTVTPTSNHGRWISNNTHDKLTTIILDSPEMLTIADAAYEYSETMFTKYAPNARIYVPDNLVELYKADFIWKRTADRIYPMSEAPSYLMEHPWDD